MRAPAWLPDRSEVSLLVRRAAHTARALAGSLETPREVFLAVSELAHRRGGDRPALADDAPLTGFELRAFSQNGEDGVLVELLRRAGDGGRFFVEFGAGDGTENNSVFLADVLGWSGFFVEGDPAQAARLAAKYRGTRVRTATALITPETVDDVFDAAGVPPEPDVLSIDVDGDDYWIWRGLHRHRPRILVIEYNAALGTDRALVQPDDRDDSFDQTSYGGASIAALRALGVEKGYRLVHTELTGNNAFFVRTDQPGTYPDPEAVPLRPPNYYLNGAGRPDPPAPRGYVDLA
ncbi:MAG: hypothetical protein QOE44_587 [Solirubrobacteraceae bacterium]|nr:hypothetical protein [Solirubrobacteraceae bacterium]